MALASTVHGRDGQTLLKAGTPLDSDVLERLIRRGVETLWVQTPGRSRRRNTVLELRNAQDRVNTIFRGHDTARAELRKAIIGFVRSR